MMRRRLPDSARFFLSGICLFAASAAPCGCAKNTSGKWFEKPHSSREWLDIALEAQSADERRRGVVGLSRSQDGQTEWAMKVFDTVARTDQDTMVRCAAVKAFWPAATAQQVPTLLKIMRRSRQRSEDVRPAAGPLRWAAARVLLAVVDQQRYGESQRKEIINTLLQSVSKDDDRNVRLTAVETLAYFAEQPIPWALVEVLGDDDFALQCAAERSLIALTGVTHHHDPAAWKKWLGAAKDPFAQAGQVPEGLESNEKPRKWAWGDWDF